MRFEAKRLKRRGTVLPLVALCMIALMGMVALAIDIGMIAMARNQCQNAADASAMAGARTITGIAGGKNPYNLNTVPTNALTAATANSVFGVSVPSKNVTITTGAYAYVYNDSNPAAEGFQVQFPPASATTAYSAVQSTVSYTGSFAFGRIFGMNNFNTQGQATAIHRPRDVAVILDLSGSMRFQSLPGTPLTNQDIFGNSGTFAAAASGQPRAVSMNPDPVYPLFGHYSNTAAAALYGNTSYQEMTGEMVDPCNISYGTSAGSAICADFYANAVGTPAGPGNVAFTYVSPSGTSAPPSGDNYLALNGSAGSPPATYGSTVQSITNGKVFRGYQAVPFTGYSGGAVAAWNGYTQGPSYWGKTFFIWPPDPRGATLPCVAANYANNGAKDWRQRFFIKVNVANGNMGWLDHNNVLFDPSGQPATQGSPNPANQIVKTPRGTSGGDQTTVTELGASVTYTYRINYAAILYWLFNANQTPNPFPSTLQGGRIRYYANAPNYNDTTLNSRWWAADLGTSNSGSALSDLSERFWKDYIDFVLGVQASGAGTYANTQGSVPYSALIGNGDYFQWNSLAITQKPDPASAAAYVTGNSTVLYAAGYNGPLVINGLADGPLVGDYVTFGNNTSNQYTVASITAPVAGVATMTLNKALVANVPLNTAVKFYPYMSYTDNPYRPKHQFWFGPMTMVDYLGNYNLFTGANGNSLHWWPGTCHEAQDWACKAGVQTAIGDIQNNHPNDFVSLMFFSTPMNGVGSTGHHNRAVVSLGQNYAQMIASLWFPPVTVTGGATEITPYDPSLPEGPRADGGTAPGMGFMLAYNQLSPSAKNLRFYSQPSYALPSANVPNYRGDAGGLGRKGAVRLVIYETDGFPNSRVVSSLASGSGAGLAGSGSDSYFPIRINNPQNMNDAKNVEWPTTGGGYANSEVYTMVKQICAQSTASPPGFSTTNKPALVYCIGYGSIFEPTNKGAAQTSALTFLQTVQFYGGTSSDTNPASFPLSQQICGTSAQRIAAMQAAFTTIMQSAVPVSLIQ